MSGAEDLAKAASIEEGQEAHEFNGAFITSVNDDGTVNLNYLGGDHQHVVVMNSYVDRKVGDFVLVRSNGDHWIVLGKVGAPLDITAQVTFPPPPIIPDPPVMPPSVTWGNAAPSPLTGWATAPTTYTHDDGRVYHVRGTVSTSPPPPTTQPPPPTQPPPIVNPPKTTAITPQAERSFIQHGWPDSPPNDLEDLDLQYQNLPRRIQGRNKTNTGTYPKGPHCGAWYYGTDLVNAVVAGFLKMEIFFQRESFAHGLSSAVAPKVYVHYFATPMSYCDLIDGPWSGPALTLGGSAWWTVPAGLWEWFDPAWSMKGIAIWAESLDAKDFFIAAPGTGQVRITK